MVYFLSDQFSGRSIFRLAKFPVGQISWRPNFPAVKTIATISTRSPVDGSRLEIREQIQRQAKLSEKKQTRQMKYRSHFELAERASMKVMIMIQKEPLKRYLRIAAKSTNSKG